MQRWLKAMLLLVTLMLSLSALAALPPNIARLHYNRSAGDYAGWGMHLWGDVEVAQNVSWAKPFMPAGQDSFGVYFDIPITPSTSEIGFILHRGNAKNVYKNMKWSLAVHGREIWQLEDDPIIYTSRPSTAGGEAASAATGKVVALPKPAPLPKTAVPAGTDAATVQLLDRIQREMATRFELEQQNMARVQAQLLTEQQARQVAEQMLRQREEMLAKLQQTSVLQDQQNKKRIQQLDKDLKDRERAISSLGTPNRGGVWFVVLMLLIIGWIATYLRQKSKESKLAHQCEHLNGQFTEVQDRLRLMNSEREQAEQRILQLANYDELTGLPNRAILNQTIGQALSKSRRYKKQLAVLFIDLDRFKLINDTMGHGAGDYVLKTVAERFRLCVRESDTLARLGGDEFVVLIEDLADPRFVAGIAQKLVAAAQQPFVIQGQEFHVTASIGIAAYPSDGKDPQTLMKNADIAMYRAKEQGKNNFQYYSEQLNMHSLQRLALESSLRHALSRNEFLLHYQPIVETASKRIVGVEALARWKHPDMGVVGPLQFIPIAEETGLIADIGRWVLRTACLQGKRWHDAGHRIYVSVNLSPRQLNEAELLAEFKKVLAETGFDPRYLLLEITESLMLANPDETVVVLQELKELGLKVAIDDFGTGYSSLSYLRRFPIDVLKIDRSFLHDIPGDDDASALTSAVIALAHSMRLDVIAEGVETDEQWQFLMDRDCHKFQGYWFAKPQDTEAVTRLLQEATVQF